MRVSLGWSGGKDAAHVLHRLQGTGRYEVVELYTVIDASSGEVPQHGIPEALITEQSRALGVPVEFLYLPRESNAAAYKMLLSHYYSECSKKGIGAVAHGDIFLDDLKDYRERLVKPFGLKALFPLWKENTSQLLSDFIQSGFEAIICSANETFFSSTQLGKPLEASGFPPGVDPCGERGEFHTFVYDGPIFNHTVGWESGRCKKKEYEFGVVGEDGRVQTKKSVYLSLPLSPRIAT